MTTIAKAPTLGANERILSNGRRIYSAGRGVVLEVAEYERGDRRRDPAFGHTPGLLTPSAADGRKLVVVNDLTPGDPTAEFERIVRCEGRRFGPLAVAPHDPIRDELARLEGMGLHASAAAIRAANPPAEVDPELAELGDAQWEAHRFGECGFLPDAVIALARRFARGDWGLHGSADDVGTLDADMLALPSAYGQAVRNAVAARTGSGVVKGEYPAAFNRSTREVRFLADDRSPYGWEARTVRVARFPAFRKTLVYIA